MASEMTERVARGIEVEMARLADGVIIAGQPLSAATISLAKAAILALREPTEAMALAFVEEWNALSDADKTLAKFSVFGMWRAMIDAAVKE